MMLKPILAGTLKLDGGAMFGVVPKKIWSKLMPPDDQKSMYLVDALPVHRR